MQKKHGYQLMGAACLLGLGMSAQAALIDRGNGMIYDDVQNITWLSDANYAVTSGYAAANAVNNGSIAFDNIFTDGRMGWNAATAWADQLVFGGYDDWRLFNADPSDTNCSQSDSVGEYYGHNCTGNELGHLFYEDLGVLADQSILSSTDPDLALFSNIQSNFYWSGTEYAPNTNAAWLFASHLGAQYNFYKYNEMYAWAVRDGDVAGPAPMPEPSILALFGLGAFGLMGLRRRHRSLADS